MALNESILKQFTFSSPPTIQLPRSKKVQEAYNNYKSSPSYNFEDFKQNIKKKLTENYYFIQKNDFPYMTEKNIEHLIIWTNNLDSTIQFINRNFKENLVTFWKNLSSNCSIPEIDHIHVFVKL